MVDKYRGRASSKGHRVSETDHFLAGMPNRQWILTRHGQVWRPPTDVYETDDSIVVKVEVAGMTEDEFSLVFAEQTLVIAGSRRDLSSRKRSYNQMEIPYGEFRTEVYVPDVIDASEVEAIYKDGFLLVTLPKRKTRRISIRSDVAT